MINRMKLILPHCITASQAIFIQGQNIIDNILGVALKLDMEKDFGRMEWAFLREVMLHMGFPARWVDLLMHFIDSVSFIARVNGSLSSIFYPQLGLRQWDPMSPLLFLICTRRLYATLYTMHV
ncbi:hypothetical protein GQ457_18G012160 [Hibiscus cannabinus]